MYRIKILDKNAAPTYRWYDDLYTACLVANTITNNRDAQRVIVENLKEHRIEIIYKAR